MPRYWHLIYVKFCFHGSEQTEMFFLNIVYKINMFYSVELQMAGVILLTAMAAGGISLWLKRRKLEKESTETVEQDVSEHL